MTEQSRDPTLEEVIRAATDRAAEELRVSMPGRVESYNTTTHLASVKPLLKVRYRGRPAATDLPVIHQVPVMHPRTARATVLMPVAKGDIVLLVFADRALDNWIPGSGAEKEPRSHRKHDLSDAYAIPGGYPAGNPLPPLFPGALEIRLATGTKLAISNGSVELLTLIDALLTQLQILTVNGNIGYPTGVPNNAAAFLALQTQLATMKP